MKREELIERLKRGVACDSVSAGDRAMAEAAAMLEADARLAETMARLEAWLKLKRGGTNDDAHRVTINVSLDPAQFFVRLEVGSLGHGPCVWWGKGGPNVIHALRGALDAQEREPEPPHFDSAALGAGEGKPLKRARRSATL